MNLSENIVLDTSTSELNKELKILLLEDSNLDVELIRATLRKELCFKDLHVADKSSYMKALNDFNPDIVLSDYSMPQFNGLEALALLQSSSKDCPFIIVTGAIDEETAVACIKAGADDYLLKDRLLRLPAAIKHSLFQHRNAREKEASRQKLEETHLRLRELLNRLELVRDDEKRRISREIHDQLGQELTANKLGLFYLKQQLVQGSLSSSNTEQFEIKLDELLALSANTSKTVRRIAHQLRPIILDELGLVCAVESMINKIKDHSEVNWKVSSDIDALHLSKSFALTAYRVCQEAITNVLKHAKATKCSISFKYTSKELQLSVCDNGLGFNIESKNRSGKLGLFGMEERIKQWEGVLKISHSTKGGTNLVISFPLSKIQKTMFRP
jgi:signal transduction histidine kinase